MPLMEKQCSKCKQVLSIENFSKHAQCKDGLRSYCKKCAAKSDKQWRQNAGNAKRKQWLDNGGREWIREYRASNSVRFKTADMLKDARMRARHKSVPFDIDIDYLRSMVGENAELASRCPVFHTPLDWSCYRGDGNNSVPNSPSLDRIDPERGYVKGNVWIISHKANRIKSDATHEELKLVTKAVGEALVNSLEF
jgi:hypothetical protein